MDRPIEGHRGALLQRGWSVRSALTAAFCGALACTEPEPVAVQLEFLVQPVTTTRAVPFASVIQVEAQDAGGRRVTSWNGDVSLTLDTATSVFEGARTVNAVAGLATFQNLAVAVAGSNFQLVAAATGLRSGRSLRFDVAPGPPAQLGFVQSPTRGRLGAPLEPFVVELRDAGGFRNRTDARAITLSLASAPADARLDGSLTVTSVDGVATFRDLMADKAGDYALKATAPGLSEAFGGLFHIRPTFVSASVGYFHACGRAQNGVVYCWGDGSVVPTRIATAPPLTTISSGRDTRCGLTGTGVAYCWDGNATPSPVSSTISFVAVAAGYAHSCGLTSSGAAYCWGDNSEGQLGNGSFGGGASAPVAVQGGHVFAHLSPGRYFTCGVTTNAAAYCWGSNTSGQIGNGETDNTAVPTPVTGGHTFAIVGAGGWFSCGLTTAGDAHCWGSNHYGELGRGTMEPSLIPVAVAGGRKYTALAVGNRHACALTSDGTAYCWGDNSTGMVGVPGSSSTQSPAAVAGNLAFTSIHAGRFHTCGVASDAETYCWGSNAGGLLGSPGSSTSNPRLVQ